MRLEVMVVRLHLVLFVFLACSLACAVAAAGVTPLGLERKTLVAAVTAEPPVIDGDLSDAAWKLAQPSGGFVSGNTGRPAWVETTVWALSDADHLYLAFVCAEPSPGGPRARKKGDNQDLWGEDCVEFNLVPTVADADIYQIRVNPLGAKDLFGRDDLPLDVTPLRAAAKVGAGDWRVELAIPFEALGIRRTPAAQMRWRINFERLRTTGGEQGFHWQYAASEWSNPAVYGELLIPGAEAEIAAAGLAPLEEAPGGRATFALKSLVSSEREYVCRVFEMTQPPKALGEKAVALPGAGQAGVAFPVRLPRAAGQTRTLWEVAEAASGATLCSIERMIELPEPMRVRMQAPRYRGYVFPDLKEVRAKVSVAGNEEARGETILRARVLDQDGSVKASQEIAGPPAEAMLTLPAKGVGGQPCVLEVALLDKQSGEALATESFPLRRLSAAQVKALQYYVDEYGRLVREGKPFLPIGFYGGSSIDQLKEVGASPFNAMLSYGMDTWDEQGLKNFLDTAEQVGVHMIFCANDLYPGPEGTEEQWAQACAAGKALVEKWKDHPAVMAWYLNDERPPEMIPGLTRYYETFRDADPDHPCFIVHHIPERYPLYAHTTDIFAPDPYPIPNSVAQVGKSMEASLAALDGQGAVWCVPQAFAWYQYWQPQGEAEGGRGRIPTADELKRGRAPTREEERCMTWLALVHGAKGLIYYCYYDLRVLPQYQEMWGWMQDLCGEVQSLEQVILSPKDLPAPRLSPTPKEGALHCLAKEYEGKAYCFLVNSETHPWTGRVQLPAGVPCVRAVDLLSGEALDLRGDSVSVRLAPLGVRVLRLE